MENTKQGIEEGEDEDTEDRADGGITCIPLKLRSIENGDMHKLHAKERARGVDVQVYQEIIFLLTSTPGSRMARV